MLRSCHAGSPSSERGRVADSGSRWVLDQFLEQLDSWIERESPGGDLRLLVTAWVLTRDDDPYAGVQREPEFDSLWFGPVPDSEDGAGHIVACSYWIDEEQRIVRCNGFSTLSLPL